MSARRGAAARPRRPRVLVASVFGPGHVLPNLGLCEALVASGAEVVFYGEKKARRQAREAGCRFVADPAPELGPVLASLRSPRQLVGLMRRYAEVTAPHLLDVLRRTRVDAVVTDALHLGAGLAAARSGLPWASLATTPAQLSSEARQFAQARIPTRSLRRSLGLPPSSEDSDRQAVSPHKVLLTWTPEFALGAAPPQAKHVGPLNFTGPMRAAPAGLLRALRQKGKPWVLAGTSTGNLDVFAEAVAWYVSECIAALNRLPVRALVTAGSAPLTVREAPARHVRLETFVPHGAVMPHLSAVVTHGGWGTLGRAFTAGVPVVVVPFGQDQPMNAAACERAGVGVALALESLDADALVAAVSRVLKPGSRERKKAQALAKRIARLDPGRTAAREVLSMLDLEPTPS